MKNLSKTLKYMINTGEGYRNTYCASGIIKLSEIIKFEINELNNMDIIDFMKLNYSNYNPYLTYDNTSLIQYTLKFIANMCPVRIRPS